MMMPLNIEEEKNLKKKTNFIVHHIVKEKLYVCMLVASVDNND